jgi:hypothetical protein
MGFTLSAHYCGEDLKSISVLADPESCCDMPDGCCHDEAETFRIDNDFASSTFQFASKLNINFVLDYFIPINESLLVRNFSTPFFLEPPPPTTKQVLSSLQVYIL